MKAIRRFSVRPVLPEPLRPLSDLARNLRWSWHHETRELFRYADPDGWHATGGDPLRLLGSVSAGRLAELAHDRRFLRRLKLGAGDLGDYLTEPRWYQNAAADLPAAIAYFSPEFGITSALPQYSGGLGILAGDHLKAASDLGVPLVGVGLLYRHGYFRQSLSRDGWQQESYPVLDPDELPLELVREPDGTPVDIALTLPGGRTLHAHVWLARVGRVPLLLLDSDVEENAPGERGVTDRLYGGGREQRLLQEMLLGIGGVRAVRAYCRLSGHRAPEVFHTNEGHAGFLGLERIRELRADGLPFDAALEAVRAGTVFTTHTPVPAGIDRFDRSLISRYFGDDGELAGVDAADVLALGVETAPEGDPALFNMAVMGLRLAQRANGVSTLHGAVSRRMFAGLWPGFDAAEVPITSITNGVHAPTWVAPEITDRTPRLADGELWDLRRDLREQLVEEVRRRLRAAWRERGAADAELGWIDHVLDPDVLTVGFARRVPSYKRLTLMLSDPDRLRRLLLHPERPIQLVVAGKAHPADDGGKRLIQDLVHFADDPRVRHRIVFLPDYGMAMAQKLYPGCDVWLNNPLRPLEACGTSGMKSALNGGLNLSVLDGWWDEWYESDFGWAIPTADGPTADGPSDDGPDAERRDAIEAAALYSALEEQVAPCFYDRPERWLEMVRQTLTRLGPKVLAGRMVRDYVQGLYAPAAQAHRVLDPAVAPQAPGELAAWKARVRSAWPRVRVDHVEAAGPASDSLELGGCLTLRVRVTLGELEPAEVEVQAVTGRVDHNDTITDPETVLLKPAGRPDLDGRRLYEGELALDRTGPFGYTVRVLPMHRLLAGPAELGLAAMPTDGAAVTESGVLMR
ncbi:MULTISPECIES: alpha-glucan family phosphorylase [unclassified Streptomyces]|uniref:alpha-glucan family phosphorylase n=1 Tax=unclassified Streptomyces TaxID=2593676 RepID=UPI0022B6A6FA|nr:MULTISPECIES: alpha-glucan family phosphorylase [unclassified Streptomyces]MCZ7416424.1 alpha-glucan family phosphorylase [Streptomyces sp. WMMC897]MCZ7433766.1 alpha-glucan family phosphorylase [Streptomyces sp. WMMC1477]